MKSIFHLQIVLVPVLWTGCSRGTNKAVVNLAPTMILAKVVTSVSCEEKKINNCIWAMDSLRREAENMKEGVYLWIFTIATRMTEKNKSTFSLLNGKVSFGVMSAKRHKLNKKLWQVGSPGCLTKILNDIVIMSCCICFCFSYLFMAAK